MKREKKPALREAVLSALSSFIRSDNFPGKRQFITKLNGLELLCEWNCMKGDEEKKMFGSPAQTRKIRLKLLQLLYDLILNDDSIYNDGFYVRD